jgi:hypothetical protein
MFLLLDIFIEKQKLTFKTNLGNKKEESSCDFFQSYIWAVELAHQDSSGERPYVWIDIWTQTMK